MDFISKIKVDSNVYDIKDATARSNNESKVDKQNAVLDGSLKSEGSAAAGLNSIGLGNNVSASGNYTNASGTETLASGQNSHAEGNHTEATAESSHSEGIGSYDESTESWTYTSATGEAAHAEGKATKATGEHSHAEGCETLASGHASHAEGCTNRAAASYSHIEGTNNQIISTVDADGNNEKGVASHVEGASNINSASYAHVEGYENIAGIDAQYVHVSGKNNQANYENNQVIIGQYNDNNAEDIFEFGGGYLDTSGEVNQEIRKNLIRMTKDGKMYISLNDILFTTFVDNQQKIFSLINAALVDDDFNLTSTHPIQNKVITEKINEVFQLVSEGKTLIASALSDLGYEASSSMKFQELADVIKTINPGYIVDSEYLFMRDNKYYTTEGTIINLATPEEKFEIDSFLNFYSYTES